MSDSLASGSYCYCGSSHRVTGAAAPEKLHRARLNATPFVLRFDGPVHVHRAGTGVRSYPSTAGVNILTGPVYLTWPFSFNDRQDNMPKYLMVLNDGETYTDVTGCTIVAVPDDSDPEQIEEILRGSGGWELQSARKKIVTFCVTDSGVGAVKPNGTQINFGR